MTTRANRLARLCSLLLAHGANPLARNEEGQTPLDLATAEDARCLLSDAMPSAIGAPVCLSLPPLQMGHLQPSTSTDGPRVEGQGRAEEDQQQLQLQQSQQQQQAPPPPQPSTSSASSSPPITTASFLKSLGLDHLVELFDKEQVTLDILVELGHEELKELGVVIYGQRHKIIKGISRYRSLISAATASTALPAVESLSIAPQRAGSSTGGGAHFRGVGVHEPMPPGSDYFPAAAATETVFVDVPRDSNEFRDVEEQVKDAFFLNLHIDCSFNFI